MFGIFNTKPLFDEETTNWLFDVFDWALRNFDAEVFHQHTALVLPNDQFFPEQANNPHDMVRLVFERIKGYAGMAHWPFLLVDASSCQLLPPPKVEISGALRGPGGITPASVPDNHRLAVAYDPAMVNNPEALVAGFAHTLAHYLGSMASEPAPGGEENWPHITELLAVFLGFGVMFANSAYIAPARSCGSCGPAQSTRTSYLSQYHMTYALAIFCTAREIPSKEVTGHLKSTLRSYFKRCMREIKGHEERISRIKKQ